MEDLTKFSCQNKECSDYLKLNAGNLTVCGRFGKNKHIRLLYCRTCKYRFSERKGTPLFGLRLNEEKMASVFNHISEGCGIRQTSRLVGVHRDTVSKYRSAAGKKVKKLYQELAANNSKNKEIPLNRNLPFADKKDSPNYENHLEESKPQDNKSQFDADQRQEVLSRSIALEPEKAVLSQKSALTKENEDQELDIEILSDS